MGLEKEKGSVHKPQNLPTIPINNNHKPPKQEKKIHGPHILQQPEGIMGFDRKRLW